MNNKVVVMVQHAVHEVCMGMKYFAVCFIRTESGLLRRITSQITGLYETHDASNVCAGMCFVLSQILPQ